MSFWGNGRFRFVWQYGWTRKQINIKKRENITNLCVMSTISNCTCAVSSTLLPSGTVRPCRCKRNSSASLGPPSILLLVPQMVVLGLSWSFDVSIISLALVAVVVVGVVVLCCVKLVSIHTLFIQELNHIGVYVRCIWAQSFLASFRLHIHMVVADRLSV